MPEVLLKATLDADVVAVPSRTVLSIEGQGAPEGEPFRRSIGALYGVAYTLKFARKRGGRGDFRVGALEGSWGIDGPESAFLATPREEWRWRLRLAVPDDVTAKEVATTIATATTKKGGKLEASPEAARVELERISAARWGRVLHVGPYKDEAGSVAKIRSAIEAMGGTVGAGHVEIYLGDPRRTKPEKLRTVLLVGVAEGKGAAAQARGVRAAGAGAQGLRGPGRKTARIAVR
jgi:hypothetical protein